VLHPLLGIAAHSSAALPPVARRLHERALRGLPRRVRLLSRLLTGGPAVTPCWGGHRFCTGSLQPASTAAWGCSLLVQAHFSRPPKAPSTHAARSRKGPRHLRAWSCLRRAGASGPMARGLASGAPGRGRARVRLPPPPPHVNAPRAPAFPAVVGVRVGGCARACLRLGRRWLASRACGPLRPWRCRQARVAGFFLASSPRHCGSRDPSGDRVSLR